MNKIITTLISPSFLMIGFVVFSKSTNAQNVIQVRPIWGLTIQEWSGKSSFNSSSATGSIQYNQSTGTGAREPKPQMGFAIEWNQNNLNTFGFEFTRGESSVYAVMKTGDHTYSMSPMKDVNRFGLTYGRTMQLFAKKQSSFLSRFFVQPNFQLGLMTINSGYGYGISSSLNAPELIVNSTILNRTSFYGSPGFKIGIQNKDKSRERFSLKLNYDIPFQSLYQSSFTSNHLEMQNGTTVNVSSTATLVGKGHQIRFGISYPFSFEVKKKK